jgi:uncharacterized protein YukE
MAIELPARLAAVAPAAVVTFPWDQATAAVAALNDAVAALATHRETRTGMEPGLVEWHGSFRDDFDGAYADVRDHASDLEDELTRRANAIVGAAEDANDAQRRLNQQAED